VRTIRALTARPRTRPLGAVSSRLGHLQGGTRAGTARHSSHDLRTRLQFITQRPGSASSLAKMAKWAGNNGAMVSDTLGSVLAPFNRPRAVEASVRDFLHSLYEFLRDRPMSEYVKQRTFEAAADSNEAWRIVAISQSALAHLNAQHSTKGLRRGHAVGRAVRANRLFGPDSKAMTAQELVEYFFAIDTVALVTAHENGADDLSRWSPLFRVPEGVFNSSSYSVKYRVRTERPWVVETLQKIEAGELRPFWPA
jgi:hypothetical protein